MENNYCVYMHILRPDGRKYIGITHQSPARRWANGLGYKKNSYFWNAIEKYGWDSFKHEIVFENLTKEQACNKEQALIKLFNTQDRSSGFNLTAGGEGALNISEEARKKRSMASTTYIISKDELEYHLIILGETIKQCATTFNCSASTISYRAKLYSLVKNKNTVPNRNNISKKELSYQYIALNKTREECAEYFNCSLGKIQAYMRKYNIKKDPKVIAKNTSLRLQQCPISQEDLYYQYIILNKTQEQCATYFNCTRRIIRGQLKVHNIKKEANVYNKRS